MQRYNTGRGVGYYFSTKIILKVPSCTLYYILYTIYYTILYYTILYYTILLILYYRPREEAVSLLKCNQLHYLYVYNFVETGPSFSQRL